MNMNETAPVFGCKTCKLAFACSSACVKTKVLEYCIPLKVLFNRDIFEVFLKHRFLVKDIFINKNQLENGSTDLTIYFYCVPNCLCESFFYLKIIIAPLRSRGISLVNYKNVPSISSE